MKISGICGISKNKTTNSYILNEAITKSGNRILTGSIYWTDSKKGDDKKTYSDIRFAAFGDSIDIINHNKDKLFEIKDCPIKKNKWLDKEGKWQSSYEITIFQVVTKCHDFKDSTTNPPKPFNEMAEYDYDDEVPF